MIIFRSILFNIAFYICTLVACIVLLPFLVLPYQSYWKVLNYYFKMIYVLEKYIIGLDYEVRGTEHLPKDGAYLVAAKHQSAYETMKLALLFDMPGIILKKELVRIPLWGWFALKADMIPIDRKSRETALSSLTDGALKFKNQGRPAVIFPQGTRVPVGEKKSYKGGILRMQEATGLKVIPLAMNSGLFWPKKSFIKKPGVVTFEFLPELEMQENQKATLKVMESILEPRTDALVAEAREKYSYL